MQKSLYLKKFTLKDAWATVERLRPFLERGEIDEALAVLRDAGVGPETRYNKEGRFFFEQIRPGEFDSPSLTASKLELIGALFDAGWNVDAQDDYGWSHLHRAVYSEAFETVRFLLRRGADPEILDDAGYTPLDFAITHFKTRHNGPSLKSAKCLEALILGGANIYRAYDASFRYKTPLDWVENLPEDAPQRKTFFDALAKRDALKQTSQEPETPNAQPLIRKEKAMTKPLKPLSKVTLKVANAAFLEIMSLVYARRFDEALDVLRENRIGPTTTYDGAKRRFLAYFAQICLVFDRQKEDVLDFMKLLVDEEGWDPRYQDLEGMSYLHLAAANRSPDTLRFFLERGVEPDVLNLDDGTPLDIAISYTYHGFTVEDASACVETLILAGADPYRAYSPKSRHIGLLGKIYNSPLERVQQDGEKYPSCAEALFNAIAKRDALRQTSQEPETPNA